MLRLENLEVRFVDEEKNENIAVKDISYQVASGEILGIVGESGCGKSVSSLALMGLLPDSAKIVSGKLDINGVVKDLTSENVDDFRGKEISMIFQEPMTSLNPLVIVGKQISEAYYIHHRCTKKEAKEAALKIMEKVGLSRVEKLYSDFPHQLSGGMRQRIMIAIALVNNPSVIIADEPTTALDVTIQAQILDLLKYLNQEFNLSVIFISHNLGVIRELCNRVIVMYAGYIVEEGPAEELFKNPKHPYTKGLLASIPTASKKGSELHTIKGMVSNIYLRDHDSCCFHYRCEHATDLCKTEVPKLEEVGSTKVRCFRVGEV